MIVDSSAVVAIFAQEQEAPLFMRTLEQATVRRMSAATLLELSVVLQSKGDVMLGRSLDDFLAAARIIIEPVTEQQARIGQLAYRDFGKGSKHRAKLNFGDCFAYALAKVMDEPLLYKGNDFVHTDLRSAV